MPRAAPSRPPRPIQPGDIVAAYSEVLGEWTAGQITDLNAEWRTAGLLELDWSGAEPSSVADLGPLKPLKLTHHSWPGTFSHCNYEWVLPRSYRVLGVTTLLHDRRSHSYSHGWHLGRQLALQRRWDSGDHGPWSDPTDVSVTGTELIEALADRSEPLPHIRSLSVKEVTTLDCQRLVVRYPQLTSLSMAGDIGQLLHAVSLNDLSSLKTLYISGLFGMDESDCILPDRVPALEFLSLYSIPAAFASAMRSKWRNEVANGTFVDIKAPRRPEWVAENASNPLREWDGRDHISPARFRQAVSQHKATRRAVLRALADAPEAERDGLLVALGREFAEAFNKLDARKPFIETVEREELFGALGAIVEEAEGDHGVDLSSCRDRLWDGVEAVRRW